MAWTNPETFTAGQTLTAASMNAISDNARMGRAVFTNEAARDAAITGPEEGMIAYLTAPTVPAGSGGATYIPSGITTIYDGSAWVCVTPVGAYTSTSATTASTSYTASLSTGTTPAVTLVTGTTALVSIGNSQLATSGFTVQTSVAVSGATTLAASDNYSMVTTGNTAFGFGLVFVISGLTAGTNTFTMNHKTAGGTATIANRRITVQGIA